MRKLLYVGILLLLVSFGKARYYQFKMSESQANFHWQNLENLKLMLDNSSLPHSQVKMALISIDSLQRDMQLGLTIDSTDQHKSK
ncbi:MAG: hypothetical protein ACO3AY_03690 [Chitinophagaceae bacterium]